MSHTNPIVRACARRGLALRGTEARGLEAELTETEVRLHEARRQLEEAHQALETAIRDRDILVERVARMDVDRVIGRVFGGGS